MKTKAAIHAIALSRPMIGEPHRKESAVMISSRILTHVVLKKKPGSSWESVISWHESQEDAQEAIRRLCGKGEIEEIFSGLSISSVCRHYEFSVLEGKNIMLSHPSDPSDLP